MIKIAKKRALNSIDLDLRQAHFQPGTKAHFQPVKVSKCFLVQF